MAQKNIPQSRIFRHFFTLPDEQCVRLIRKHMTPEKILQYGKSEFKLTLDKLKEDPAKLRAFVRQKFGGSRERLAGAVKKGEYLARNFLRDIYKFEDKTDEDKLCALIRDNTTMPGRLDAFYEFLTEEDQKKFQRQGIINTKNDDLYIQYQTLSEQQHFIGGSNKAFLDDVLKTMDLSKVKSTMGYLREGLPEDDPRRREKLHGAAQRLMILAGGAADPEKMAGELKDKNWRKKFDAPELMASEDNAARLFADSLLERIKNVMNEVPETDEEKAVFREAGLQTCRDYISHAKLSDESAAKDPAKAAFLKYSRELQDRMASDALKTKPVQEIRKELAGEYEILKKEKSGWFLSKTNSKEYDDMMKALRIFNAKLDMLNGKKTAEDVTAEELNTAKNTGADVLLANAKQGLYNYASIKTKNGKGSIWHDAGTDRFDSSMKSLKKLGELGSELHLSNTATALRDETQLQVLQKRGDSKWLKENIADAFAKSICAQVSLNTRMPDCQQKTELVGKALEKQVEKIKSSGSFRKMMETASPDKLADAVIKGGSSLYEVYDRASEAAAEEGYKRTDSDIEPVAMRPKKDTMGLISGM